MRKLILLCFSIVLLAGCGGGGSNSSFHPPSYRKVSFSAIRMLDLPAEDLIYSRTTGLLYASVRDTGSEYSNTVAAIDLVSGSVVKSAPVGNNPTILALSDDSHYLYVATDNTITRLETATLQVGTSFSLGDEPWGRGPMDAKDMEVLPGKPESVVVSLMNEGYSPETYAIAIFDNGVRRTTMTSILPGVSIFALDPSDPSCLLGGDLDSTEFGLYKLRVTEEGISIEEHTPDVFHVPADDIKIAGGLMYTSAGDVVDPVSKTWLRWVQPTVCGVEPDLDKGLVYALAWDSPWLEEMFLRAFDIETNGRVASVSVEEIVHGFPKAIVKWGEDGLAFTEGNNVYLLSVVVSS